ncbi:hypothetical protein F5Y17DRAFT_395918 [Xylariaceae sp. FL0594]|nr:hypothetical protein F5Y17DRAFT_395918 [Xylariaceae sp. FL0594]
MTDAAGLAIGLAGTVLQCVVFSINFVNEAKQVYRHGATDKNIDLSLIVQSMEDTTARLEERLVVLMDHGYSSDGCWDPGEEQLIELSRRASDIAANCLRSSKKSWPMRNQSGKASKQSRRACGSEATLKI